MNKGFGIHDQCYLEALQYLIELMTALSSPRPFKAKVIFCENVKYLVKNEFWQYGEYIILSLKILEPKGFALLSFKLKLVSIF